MSDIKVSKTVFKDTQALSFFVSRGHKIVSAIYLVTALFDDREPLKWTLRSHVLKFVLDITGAFEGVYNDLEQLIFMLETAARVRLVSEMNRDVLVSEIRSFTVALDAEYKGRNGAETRSISDIFEKTPEDPLPLYRPYQTLQPERQMFIKGHSRGPIKDFQKDIVKTIQQKQASNGKERKEKILNIIREKGEITIKDIASIIPDCSEKTIQRDLADLVFLGTVKKKGERRWTVYFL
jgi:hypothetical protein